MARDRKVADDMVARAEACRLSTLVLTVDVPGSGQPRAQSPQRLRPAAEADARRRRPRRSTHPGWLLEYATAPPLTGSNWIKYAPPGSNATQVLDYPGHPAPDAGDLWDDVARIRKLWPRHLVIKGIMHPTGRHPRGGDRGSTASWCPTTAPASSTVQPAPIEVLPAICEAVGDRVDAHARQRHPPRIRTS